MASSSPSFFRGTKGAILGGGTIDFEWNVMIKAKSTLAAQLAVGWKASEEGKSTLDLHYFFIHHCRIGRNRRRLFDLVVAAGRKTFILGDIRRNRARFVRSHCNFSGVLVIWTGVCGVWRCLHHTFGLMGMGS